MNEQNPLIRIPTQPIGFTLFSVVALVVFCLGTGLGIVIGSAKFGAVGTVAGGLVGALLGFILGRVPGFLASESVFKRMQKKTNDELKAIVDGKTWNFFQTLALLNLQLRGEDVQPYLPRVIALLESQDVRARIFGRDALCLVFTSLAAKIRDYDPTASEEDRRRKLALLRDAA